MSNFESFMCGVSSLDYAARESYAIQMGRAMQMTRPYAKQIDCAADMLNGATHVLIGVGAGMSTSAGAQYGGSFFEEHFGEFQKRYGCGPFMRDMFGAGFYPYPSEEAYWGYWSKQALLAGVYLDITPLHKQLLALLAGKEIFCLSTNADGQFERAGLPANQIFCTQGDYFHIQCQQSCHQKTYEASALFRKMDAARNNCEIPTELVPKCPVCGGAMTMNLRCDDSFVEDEAWHEADARFGNFLEEALRPEHNLLLLELGVGFTTPIIIRLPFEKLTLEHNNVRLIRMNKGQAMVPPILEGRALGLDCDIAQAIADLEKTR